MVSPSGSSFPRRRSHFRPPTPKPADHAEDEQYPHENKGIDHQIADVIAARGNMFLLGDIGPILHLREQPLGLIRVGRSHHHGDQGTAPLGHRARQILKAATRSMAI